MQRIHITLRDEYADRLREEAEAEDRSISYLIQKLVIAHLDRSKHDR